MLQKLRHVPLFVFLIAIAAAAMLLPAAHAFVLRNYAVSRAFFYSGVLFLMLSALLALATASNPKGHQGRTHLLTMFAAFVLLPVVLAVPFNESVRDTGLYNSWWEMVSSLTTTGATLYLPDRLAPSLHLWRALVGWMGGFFMLVMAIAVLAPLRLGGFEIFVAGNSTGGEAPSLLRDDPELWLAAVLVGMVAAFLLMRHWIAALDVETPAAFGPVLHSLWGSLFTALSFLTTTGFESASWDDARHWSGLGTPGLILAGLAITGGGIATTAGGVRLLRVYALLRHGERELNKLVHPTSIAGGGPTARKLRREGAYIAWIFFMLFAMSIAVVMMAVSLTGLAFEPATIMSIAALSNTRPLAAFAADTPLSWADLGDATKFVLAAAMVLGRLETLAIIALFNPEFWRG